jgi:hypothetical protein
MLFAAAVLSFHVGAAHAARPATAAEEHAILKASGINPDGPGVKSGCVRPTVRVSGGYAFATFTFRNSSQCLRYAFNGSNGLRLIGGNWKQIFVGSDIPPCGLGLPADLTPCALPQTQTKSDRAAWRKLLHWPAACETSWREGGSGAGIAGVWAIARGGSLVAVDCSLGAYQGTSMLYLLDPNRHASGPLALRIYQDRGSGVPEPTTTTVVLGTLNFSRGSSTLAVRDLARGAGDCGIYSTFRLAGSRLVPIATRAKACDGKPPYDVSHWPKLIVLKGRMLT